jgi:hypothetical protein
MLILDHVQNPRDPSHMLAARHNWSPQWVRRILSHPLGKEYARVLEDRLIAESIKACAVVPAMMAFQDSMSIPVGRQRRK